MDEIARLLKPLGDEARLRLVRLLLHESLNVGELARILGLAQSTVSHKLADLRAAGIVRETRDGGYSYYAVEDAAPGPALAAIAGELRDAPDPHGDLARLAEVRRERSDRGDAAGRLVEPGRSWVAWARALGRLVPALRVADFGCGDGALTVEIAAFASRVVAVERDARRAAEARARVRRLGLDHVEVRAEPIETTGLGDAEVDLVVASHVLHHVPDPAAVAAQAARVLVPGGRLLVLELAPHAETWVKEKLGHLWLGFAPRELEKLLAGAGFEAAAVETVRGGAREPFHVLIATGARP